MMHSSILSCAHSRVRSLSRLGAAIALLGLGLSAHAATIADGGFESAGGGNEYFAGQSLDAGSWNVTQGAVYIDSGDPYVFAGANSLNLTGVNPYTADTVTQTLATIAGDWYTLSFWANADSANTFSLLIDNRTIGGPTSIADNGFPGAVTNSALFTGYTDTFRANTASTVLSFSDVSNPSLLDPNQTGSVVLDNVSAEIAPTPEPSSILLLLTGVIAFALALATKRSAAPTHTV